MTAPLPHHRDDPAPVPRPAGQDGPRFPRDWVPATLHLGRGTVRVATSRLDWILAPEDADRLERAAGHSPLPVQWNPDLHRLMVPGGHARAGSSFFTLHPAGGPA